MAKDIAVFIASDGSTASLYQAGDLVIYQRRQGVWHIARKMAFGLDQGKGLREMRQQLAAAVAFLADCKTFVALTVNGVPYFELEKADISVWEYEGKPGEFLDAILAEEEAGLAQQAKQKVLYAVPVPVETANGHYRISIKDIQENNSGVTSKQVLLPFIRKGQFYELEVLCNHLPPWLEAELATGALVSRVEKINNHEMKVTIGKARCEA
jgi:Fe-only nitrogenase accessory protein AnfO